MLFIKGRAEGLCSSPRQALNLGALHLELKVITALSITFRHPPWVVSMIRKKNAEVNSSGQMLSPASPTSNSLNQVNILCGHRIIEILALTLEVLSGTGFPETSLFYCDSYQLLLIGTYTFSSSTSGFYPSFLLGSTSSSLLPTSSSFLLSSSDLPFPFSVSSFSLPSSSLSSPVS